MRSVRCDRVGRGPRSVEFGPSSVGQPCITRSRPIRRPLRGPGAIRYPGPVGCRRSDRSFDRSIDRRRAHEPRRAEGASHGPGPELAGIAFRRPGARPGRAGRDREHQHRRPPSGRDRPVGRAGPRADGAGGAGGRGGPPARGVQPLCLRRVARCAGQAHGADLLASRRPAAGPRGEMDVAAVEIDQARRTAVRPGRGRRQGRSGRAARRDRRVPARRGPAADQRQDDRRGRGGGRLEEPAGLLRQVPRPAELRRDRGLRHREHPRRHAVDHLFAPRSGLGRGRGPERGVAEAQRVRRRRHRRRGDRAQPDPGPAVLGQRPGADPGLLRRGPAGLGRGARGLPEACRTRPSFASSSASCRASGWRSSRARASTSRPVAGRRSP